MFKFIKTHREELISRARDKVAKRLAPRATPEELSSGVPLFLNQLSEALKGEARKNNEEIDSSATRHGAALLAGGYTVGQVVHDYGDICQAITELATDLDLPVSIFEFHTLNRCLDDAIADAVTEYMRVRDLSVAHDAVENAGMFAHELRNRAGSAQLAFQAIRSGRVPINGSVAEVVTRSLRRLNALIDRSLVEVRVDAGHMELQNVPLSTILEEAEVDGLLDAGTHGVSLRIVTLPTNSSPSTTHNVRVDPQILAGALANLLQNAFKFTPAGGEVVLSSILITDPPRVAISVEDRCGGIPSSFSGQLFTPFSPHAENRGGLGLGLYISKKGVEASGGTLELKDLPGVGCVFTITLPLVT